MYTFRKAKLHDLDALVRLRADFMDGFGPLSEKSRIALSNYRGFLLEGLRSGSLAQWLAEQDGEIASTGSVHFYRLPPNASRPNGHEAYIGNMFTYPAHRGKGLGTKILQLLVDEAREADCHEVLLDTRKEARPLYERFGFTAMDAMMKYHLE